MFYSYIFIKLKSFLNFHKIRSINSNESNILWVTTMNGLCQSKLNFYFRTSYWARTKRSKIAASILTCDRCHQLIIPPNEPDALFFLNNNLNNHVTNLHFQKYLSHWKAHLFNAIWYFLIVSLTESDSIQANLILKQFYE